MCQLAAYVGGRNKADVLLKALQHQEPYYGAHATGLAVVNGGSIKLVKAPGYVSHVRQTTEIDKLDGPIGIAHSRYNSKAAVDERYNLTGMAHPFLNKAGSLALMHNGNINDYKEHWAQLRAEHVFTSYNEEVDAICDTEVAVHIVDDALSEGKTIEESLRWLLSQTTGQMLFGVIHKEHPDTIWIANWHQPCYMAQGDDEVMFCSSRRGFTHIKDDMDRIFQPPKNSLIKMTQDRVDISVLDPERKVPEMRMDSSLAKELIVNELKKRGRRDVRKLYYDLHPEGWSQVYDMSPEEWIQTRKDGVYIANPYFDLLEEMVATDVLEESVDPRWEGGVDDTPRFSYTLEI